jgi:hypothetical protein
MSKLFLSNSQINTYTDCPRKWFLDKQKRLRPNYKGSALLFGSALDAAVEHILLKKDGSYEQEFLDQMRNFEVNGTEKQLPKDILDVRFTVGDIDASLVPENMMAAICDIAGIEVCPIADFLEYCKQQRKSKTALDKTEQILFNTIAYESLKAKGLMLLEKINEWIQENVAEVHSVQKKIEIENEEGDMFIGYLDFVVTLKSGKKVLIDLKTSSNTTAYYPPDSASTSRQLGIYSQEEGIPDVAYLVGDKKIRVREPRVRLAFIEGVITEEHLDDVFEEIEECTIEIKEKLEMGEGAFEKNLNSCMNFGGCPYFNYCKNGAMKGLEYVKK